jgi:hypothetical protein
LDEAPGNPNSDDTGIYGQGREMTTQTQQFIELSDVIALRCECRHCKAVLLIPIPGDINGALLKCPKCKHEWAGQEHVGTKEPDVQRFVDSLRVYLN